MLAFFCVFWALAEVKTANIKKASNDTRQTRSVEWRMIWFPAATACGANSTPPEVNSEIGKDCTPKMLASVANGGADDCVQQGSAPPPDDSPRFRDFRGALLLNEKVVLLVVKQHYAEPPLAHQRRIGEGFPGLDFCQGHRLG